MILLQKFQNRVTTKTVTNDYYSDSRWNATGKLIRLLNKITRAATTLT